LPFSDGSLRASKRDRLTIGLGRGLQVHSTPTGRLEFHGICDCPPGANVPPCGAPGLWVVVGWGRGGSFALAGFFR